MKKFSFVFLALALMVGVAQAGQIVLDGPGVGVQAPGTTSGVINVVLDLDPQDTFVNGGITFDVNNDGVIQFTDATVVNPGNRWTIAADTTTPGKVTFNASSVLSPGLSAGAQDVLFATINWTAPAGAQGVSNLTYTINAEAFFDGRDFGTDVTNNYTAVPNIVSFVPEPGSLALVGMSLVGLAFRRRNG